MEQQSPERDELKEAARRSSNVMGAFAARRHSGAGVADYQHSQRVASSTDRHASGGERQLDGQASSRRGLRDDVERARSEEAGGKARAGDRRGKHPGSERGSAGRQAHRRLGPGEQGRSDNSGRTGRKGSGAGKHAQQKQGYPKTLAEFISQNSVFILGVSAVVIAVVIIIAILRVLMPQFGGGEGQDGVTPSQGSVVTSTEASLDGAGTSERAQAGSASYDWDNLIDNDGRFEYVVDGKVKSRLGVDISDHQPGTDWEAVAADGIDFAIVRLGYRGATEGVMHLDEQFVENIDGAEQAGLDRGVYFFSQAITIAEAEEEADFILKSLDGRKLEYPVVFDFETSVYGIDHPRTENLSAEQLVAIAEAFCKRVKDAGYDTMVYGNGFDLARYTDDYLADHSIWWAEYGPSVPSYDGGIAMWQYTSGGSVAGVNGGADMSIDLRGIA